MAGEAGLAGILEVFAEVWQRHQEGMGCEWWQKADEPEHDLGPVTVDMVDEGCRGFKKLFGWGPKG